MTICKTVGTVIIGVGLVLSSWILAGEPNPSVLDGHLSRDDVKDRIREHVQHMDVPALIGQKLLVGLPWATEVRDRQDFLTPLLEEYKIGNLFVSDGVYRDWHSFIDRERTNERPDMEKIKQHIASIRTRMREANIFVPPIVATDYEGGRVQHLRHESMPPTQTPSPMAFAAAAREHPDDIDTFGSLVGERLRQLGFTTNFAPLADLSNETSAPIIGTRSYSSEPSVVQVMARKFAKGLVEEGIVPVLKHWPGLGGDKEHLKQMNENLDVHDFKEPLLLKWPISRYGYLYKSLLSSHPFEVYGAVMSAHVISDEYKNRCQKDLGDTVSTM